MRLHILSVIIVACAMLSFGGVVAPERAMAQVTCDPADGNVSASREVRYITFRAADGCIALPFSHNPYTYPFSMPFDFMLHLPGNGAVNGSANPAQVNMKNASGVPLDVTMIACDGATVGKITAPVSSLGVGEIGQILLDDQESCELYVFWENDPNDDADDISLAGGTLTRDGEVYEITTFTLAGGQFGGTSATTIGPAIDVQRNNVSFSDGDIDALGAQTVGMSVTETYTICNTGTVELTGFNVGFANPSNLVDPGGSNPEVVLVDVTGGSDLGTSRALAIGECLDVSATFTPDDATDFSFELRVSNSTTPNETLSIIANGSDSTVSGTSASQVIARTQRIISNFMGRRAAQIVGKEPDLTKRLSDGGNSSSANGPVSVTGEGTANNNNLAFATSLRQVIGSSQLAKQKRIGDGGSRMALGARREGGSLKDGPVSDSVAPKQRNGFGLWTEGTWARVDDDTAKSDFGLLYVGADYRFNSGLVVGVIAQFDRMDEEDDTNDFAIEGKGWMAGPYVVARLGSNLIFDARAAWGKSDNEVSPYNTYTDSFDGQRRLVRGRLTGDFTFGAVHVAPLIGVIYFEEQQKAYTDSNGYAIGEQTVKLGRLTFGPKVSTSFTRADGTTIAPFIAIQGIWDFKRTDQVDIDTGFAVTGSDKFRARTEAGLSIRLPQGVAITGEGFYDGIGANGFDAYGGSVKVGVPF